MALLNQEDTNQDEQVTVDDTGPKTFRLGTLKSGGITKAPIHGTYAISSLLQELAIHSDRSSAQDAGHLVINEAKLRENPVERLLTMIQARFWPALVRKLDANGLKMACMDAKDRGHNQQPRIYVPFGDKVAQKYYKQIAKERRDLDLDVVVLPKDLPPEFAASLRNKPGLLSLSLTISENLNGIERIQGTPFVVPGGRFNEMYGWDSYFCALGLLEQPDPTGYYCYLAKSMVDNLVYEIVHYGKILNANRSYYLTRSQPPFLTAMANAVNRRIDVVAGLVRRGEMDATGHVRLLVDGQDAWILKVMQAAMREYKGVWMAEPRFVPQLGLCRYFDEGIGIPLETEASHYQVILEGFAAKWGLSQENFIIAYNLGRIKEPELDAYFVHDRALRESGHDTTYRFEGRTVDLLTVDLNALLYRYERDIAQYIDDNYDGLMETGDLAETAEDWNVKAEARRQRMRLLMWDGERGLWFDYDFVQGQRTQYESVTSFWALWAGLASAEEAQTMMEKGLPLFEVAGGLVAGTERSRGEVSLLRPNRQWDYPCGWAPHQMLAWAGLLQYGYNSDARRLVYRWLYMITKCFAEYNAVVPEKFDVVAQSHKVDAEYGNVGVDFRMVPREGFGWMNASYQVGLSLLSRSERRALELLIPPGRLFGSGNGAG